jgi:type VII secretion system ESX-1 substrate
VARPADWEWRPLGLDRDPVPGDPSRISDEAQHLNTVAAEISDQVAALRKMASADNLVGEYAEKLRSSAKDLADQLDKVAGRYQKVSSALSGWIPDLERAQLMSVQALDQAEGPYKQLNQTVALPAGPNLTAQQQQDVQKYHDAQRKAQDDLAAAQALLHRATSLRDSSGHHYAGVIRQACDDGVKDSWWDSFKNFIANWAWLLKDICTVLEVIATILAIVAFILSQLTGLGEILDLLILIAMIGTAVAAAGRLTLAATGNGSWADFAIDAISLLTFGAGRLVGQGIKGLAAGAKTVLAADFVDAVMQESSRGMMILKYAQLQGISALQMADRLAEFAGTLGEDGESLQGLMKVMKGLGTFGEESDAYAKLMSLGSRFTALSDAGDTARLALNFVGYSAGGAGLLGVAAPVVAGLEFDLPNNVPLFNLHIPGVKEWYDEHIGDPMTAGLSTGQANAVVDTLTVTVPPVGIPLQAYRFISSVW